MVELRGWGLVEEKEGEKGVGARKGWGGLLGEREKFKRGEVIGGAGGIRWGWQREGGRRKR